MICYMHWQHIIADYCTKYDYNLPILNWDITTNEQMFEKMSTVTHIWHRAKCYFMKYEQNHHISLWDIRINTLNVFRNSHNYANLAQSDNSILRASEIHGTWSWYPIWSKSIQLSSRNVWGWTDRLTAGWMDGLMD